MAKDHQGAVLRHVHALFSAGSFGGLSDGQLLERFKDRSSEAAELAFGALVERHGPMVLRVCRAILRDPHDAHDAFQATFLVLVRRAGSLWVRDSLGAWLHQVAYRTAHCARSGAARRRKHEQRAALRVAQSTRHDVRDDLAEVLHEELSALPERLRAPIVLCLVEGLTHEQAARHLGWPVGTLESRLARARARLRARLTRRGLAPIVLATEVTLSGGGVRVGVPPVLLDATIQVAIRYTTGKGAAAGVVSAAVLALTEGVSRMLFVTKLKMAGTALLLVAFAATGAGVWPSQKARPGDESPPPPAQQPAQKSPSIVARVDGTPITRDELIERCLARYGAKELETLIMLAVLRGACQRRDIAVTDREVEAEAERIAGGFGLSPETWYRTLQEQRGLSKEQYLRDIIYPALALRKLCARRVQVTLKDMQDAFEAQYSDKLRVRMIMVDKQSTALEIWEELKKNPAGFEKIAQERSMDSGSRALGGLTAEPITRHGNPHNVSDAAFRQLVDGDPKDKNPSHKPRDGDFTGVIQAGEAAWVILRREAVIPAAKAVSLKDERLQRQTYEMIYEAKLKELTSAVFQELVKAAAIENKLTGATKMANEQEHPIEVLFGQPRRESDDKPVKAVRSQEERLQEVERQLDLLLRARQGSKPR
jgi:RNA polymerase sigma factor (sigma-70 family)